MREAPTLLPDILDQTEVRLREVRAEAKAHEEALAACNREKQHLEDAVRELKRIVKGK